MKRALYIIFTLLIVMFTSCEEKLTVPQGTPTITTQTASPSYYIIELKGRFNSITTIGSMYVNISSDMDFKNTLRFDISIQNNSFTGRITNLKANTQYYYQYVFVSKVDGLGYRSEKYQCKTLGITPTFTPLAITDATSTSVNISTTINRGDDNIIERGVCYSTTNSLPTVSENIIPNGKGGGFFLTSITGLVPDLKYFVRAYAVTSDYSCYYSEPSYFKTPVAGSISGLFSCSQTKKVYFSQGNLQYQASTNTWRFAEHQYDYSNNDWIDLFGWGTGDNPTLTSTDYTLYSTFVDWGMNAISNGGNVANVWRTLTALEWDYIINQRANAADKRGVANVDGIYGLVLLPDDWILPSGMNFDPRFSTVSGSSSYNVNKYTSANGS